MTFPKSEQEYKKLFKISVPKILFFLFYLILSSNAYYLFFLPVFFISTIIVPLDPWSLLIFLTPIFLSVLLFVILLKIKTPQQFFWSSLVVFMLSYIFLNIGMILDPRAIEETIIYFLLIIFFTFTIKFLWRIIFINKQYMKSYFLLIPLAFMFYLLSYSDHIRLPFGNFLNELSNYHFNIYFYDSGGFTILFLNFIFCVISLIIISVIKLFKNYKK